MATHQDHPDVVDGLIHDTTHYEVVVVLHDDSDAYFYYLVNDKPIFVKTKPGDVIAVQQGGILHGVTKSTKGLRSILKLAFHE